MGGLLAAINSRVLCQTSGSSFVWPSWVPDDLYAQCQMGMATCLEVGTSHSDHHGSSIQQNPNQTYLWTEEFALAQNTE